jgi:MFS family permease
MEKATDFSHIEQARTRAAFLWTHILRAPFWAIYNLLLFILYKDLGASPFQIALFIALKPAVSLLSAYWGSAIHKRPERLISNIIWAGILGYCPFLLFPIFYNAWYVIFASALFMTMYRGVVPAWMEIFKRNLPGSLKEKIFSYASIVSYIVGSIMPLIIGPLLDRYALCWRWIFLVTALIGIAAIILQLRIPIVSPQYSEKKNHANQFLAPWKHAWMVLSSRPDFRAYQMGFMVFGGCGLMILQPALPNFFIDGLGLSYTHLSIALTLCKGIGFLLTSQLWANGMQRVNIFYFSSLVTLLGALFPFMLLLAQAQVFCIYLAYFIYGTMQAGSELSWHLSGPIFAKEEESTLYSGVNVLTVGLRGCVIPQLGALFCLFLPSAAILIIGALCCCAGALWMVMFNKKRRILLEK